MKIGGVSKEYKYVFKVKIERKISHHMDMAEC
jgi:hypothetical protein